MKRVAHVVYIDRQNAHPVLVALLDLIFHPRAAVRLGTKEYSSYRAALELLVDPLLNAAGAPLHLFKVRTIVKRLRIASFTHDPGVPYLLDSPDVPIVMEAEKDSACHGSCLSLEFAYQSYDLRDQRD
jgi:hypothetical protein